MDDISKYIPKEAKLTRVGERSLDSELVEFKIRAFVTQLGLDAGQNDKLISDILKLVESYNINKK